MLVFAPSGPVPEAAHLEAEDRAWLPTVGSLRASMA
jgi:hypothetical protein